MSDTQQGQEWTSDRIDSRVEMLEYEYVDSGANIVDASDVYLLCQEIRFDMQARVDDLTATVARLTQELAEAQQWEPLGDGEQVELHGSSAMGIPTPSALMVTPNGGVRILMQKTDMHGTSGVWYQIRLQNDHAVCKRTNTPQEGE